MKSPKHHPGQSLHRTVNRHQETLTAIVKYLRLNGFNAARPFYEEAIGGNKVAQYIVAAALQKAGREEAAKAWFDLAAAQGFQPQAGKPVGGGVYLEMLSIRGDLPSFMQFVHRTNQDGTVTSICGYCGKTVSASTEESTLKGAEARHECTTRD